MIDFSNLDSAIVEAFTQTNEELHEEIVEAFELEVYQWDGTLTSRQNGEIVGSPRNAKDTGDAQSKQQKPVILNGVGEIRGVHVNTSDHIEEIIFGFETASGRRKPGRDVYGEALSRIDLADSFSKNANIQ